MEITTTACEMEAQQLASHLHTVLRISFYSDSPLKHRNQLPAEEPVLIKEVLSQPVPSQFLHLPSSGLQNLCDVTTSWTPSPRSSSQDIHSKASSVLTPLPTGTQAQCWNSSANYTSDSGTARHLLQLLTLVFLYFRRNCPC